MKKIYLDNASTTRIYPKVIQVMNQTMRQNYGNPSSIHSFGQQSKYLIENARQSIAKLIGALASEIIFTSCGTESNNFIIRSCVENLNVRTIITTQLEHKCVFDTVLELNKKYSDLNLIFLSVDSYGEYSENELEKILSSQGSKKILVSLMHSNNEIGNLTDLLRIGTICKKYNAFFHSDTVQTIGHLPIKLKELPIDFISASAHKFHGPKGVGFTYIKTPIKLKSLLRGGEQERNLRSGTENLYGIIGMQKALELSLKNYQSYHLQIEKIKSYAIKQFKNTFSEIKFGGQSESTVKSLYTILNVLLPFKEKLIAFKLDLKGILISQGSACSSGAFNSSRVINHLLSEKEADFYTPIRISFSFYNTTKEIDHLINSIKILFIEYMSREYPNSNKKEKILIP